MTYSCIVPPEELSDAHLDALTEYHGVETREDALEELDEDTVLEVGREDGRRVGGDAVVRPCPLCDDEHTHKFDGALEEGRLVQHASKCPEAGLYWLVWFGEGEGEWLDDERFADEPSL